MRQERRVSGMKEKEGGGCVVNGIDVGSPGVKLGGKNVMLGLEVLHVNSVECAGIHERVKVVSEGRAWEWAVGNVTQSGL